MKDEIVSGRWIEGSWLDSGRGGACFWGRPKAVALMKNKHSFFPLGHVIFGVSVLALALLPGCKVAKGTGFNSNNGVTDIKMTYRTAYEHGEGVEKFVFGLVGEDPKLVSWELMPPEAEAAEEAKEAEWEAKKAAREAKRVGNVPKTGD